MGKRRVNKSARVREYYLRHPDHPPRKVIQELKHLQLTPQYVSSIKLQMKKEGLLPGARPAPSVAPAAQLPAAPEAARVGAVAGPRGAAGPMEAEGMMEAGTVDVQVILAAAQLIRRCGNLKAAHRALDQADRLAAALQSST